MRGLNYQVNRETAFTIPADKYERQSSNGLCGVLEKHVDRLAPRFKMQYDEKNPNTTRKKEQVSFESELDFPQTFH